jgi:hypothetical protein
LNPVAADALDQENQAYRHEDTGKGKKDAISKIFNAIGSVPAVKFRLQAEKDRDEAAHLRDELRQLESPRPTERRRSRTLTGPKESPFSAWQ